MSECSPYIRQAVERCKLPIGVRYLPAVPRENKYFRGMWVMTWPHPTDGPTEDCSEDALDARLYYAEAVKELTK